MNLNDMQQADLVIVGGGMVGASLALALEQSGLAIVLIESKPPVAQTGEIAPDSDERHLALSESSRRILSALNLWSALTEHSNPIQGIHVSEKGRFASTRMTATELGLPALGYVIKARRLGHQLWQRLYQQQNLSIVAPAQVQSLHQQKDRIEVDLMTEAGSRRLAARLVVFADGSESCGRQMLDIPVQQKDYGQTAMVANLHTELSHADWAFERFTPQGPFALLPNGPAQMAMISCLPHDEAARQMQLDDADFLDQANKRFGRRLGRFSALGRRQSYAIRYLNTQQHYRGRALLLGNAAHTIHPNGAQGFNLCLRDVAGLRDLLVQAAANQGDIGAAELLSRFVASRQTDQQNVLRFSDGLCQWFYNDDPLKRCLRSLAMGGVEMMPSIKKAISRRATGLVGVQPQWVRHGHG